MPMNIGGQTYSDEDIRNFFATTDNAGIAAQAASFGMNADQIAQAANIAGLNWSTADVTSASQGLGYDFGGANGAAQQATAASSPGGAQVGSNYYTGQQVRDFYANGGNDNQFAQQAGITDPWQRRDAILAARNAGGGAGLAANSGEAGLRNYFNQYQQANPNGAFAGNYQGWMADQAPHRLDAMKSGTYTGDGADQSPQDYKNAYDAGHGGMGWGKGGAQGGAQNLGMGGNDYGSSTGSGQTGGMAGGTNPYLKGMGDTIVNQMTDNYNRNQLPAMRSGAMAAGGFGGSRQGVVEANGLRDLNLGIGQNLTNLYGQDWTNSQNRNLQQQSINNSYDLGLKSNDLGFANLDSNNQQFGANYGLNVMNAQNYWAQQGVQTANGIQNTPIDYSRYFQGQTSQMAGQGGTSTSTQNNQGNPWLGALGGYQMANQYTK